MILRKLLTTVICVFTTFVFAQSIQEISYNVSGGTSTSYDDPGTILYPIGYFRSNYKTPVIFVHGIFGKLSGSYDANIDQVISYNLNAAFVQLEPTGSTIENGKLLKKMIDKVRWHYNAETVSIVAHSKGGLDTERALYGQNPYVNYSLPSFGYEKVDGVYTFSSPVRGARVADVGSTLSTFSGIVWATMWYTNGESLTSGTVNSFHNWAKSWRINSNSTFKNYYNPNGASYSRFNMDEDNTTRWWAHQSNDECYETEEGNDFVEWVYCYIGRPFQHSAGAYIDAYWEWDWFDSGWRNWHSDSDGFISEYRAKRYANSNSSPSLTPGAGDANYRTTRDANHTSLWEIDENHFSREVAPYLHRGLYNSAARSNTSKNTTIVDQKDRNESEAPKSQIMASNGNFYYGKNYQTKLIVEESNKPIEIVVYSENPIEELNFVNTKTNKKRILKLSNNSDYNDAFSGASASYTSTDELEKGIYTINSSEKDFLLIANNKETSTAFAINFNFNQEKGYNGETIEIGIANQDDLIDFSKVNVSATLSRIAIDQNTPIEMDKVRTSEYAFETTDKEGVYSIAFENLIPGSVYSLRVKAIAESGQVLLARNVINSFYVRNNIASKTVSVLNENIDINGVGLNSLEVYPIPSSEVVIVKNSRAINTISLLNELGQVIKTFTVDDKMATIDLKSMQLSSGLYILKIHTDFDTVTRKIIVK